MRIALSLVAVLAFAPLVLTADEDEGEAPVPEVDRLFLDECIDCHRPPDPAFEVDRAWLDQVHRTA
ncbi:MAG: hypothetical protein ACYTG6_09810 [Planctomycetota bacterium]|jgi:mono/diheme cytochrome c family protein